MTKKRDLYHQKYFPEGKGIEASEYHMLNIWLKNDVSRDDLLKAGLVEGKEGDDDECDFFVNEDDEKCLCVPPLAIPMNGDVGVDQDDLDEYFTGIFIAGIRVLGGFFQKCSSKLKCAHGGRVNLSDAHEGETLENNLSFCLALQRRTPTSGSTGNGFTHERFSRKRANATILPSDVKQPIIRRVTSPFSNRGKGSLGNEPGFFPKSLLLGSR